MIELNKEIKIPDRKIIFIVLILFFCLGLCSGLLLSQITFFLMEEKEIIHDNYVAVGTFENITAFLIIDGVIQADTIEVIEYSEIWSNRSYGFKPVLYTEYSINIENKTVVLNDPSFVIHHTYIWITLATLISFKLYNNNRLVTITNVGIIVENGDILVLFKFL